MSRNGTPYHRLLNSTQWRTLRARQLEISPFCLDCCKEGVLTEATEVHHVRPVETGRTPEAMAALAYDSGNLVSLCRRCHHERHRKLGSHADAKGRAEEKVCKEVKDFWERYS